MKKLILMIALVVGVTTYAQDRRMDKKQMSVETKVEKMTVELDLTADQQAKVKEIYAKKAETKTTQTHKAGDDAFDKELRAILTPEQIRKWDAKKAEKKLKKEQDGLRKER